MENEIFEASYLYLKFLKQATYIRCNSKATEISSNQYAGLLRFFFTEHYLKIKKGLELVSRSHKLAKFHYQTVYFPSYSIKCVSCFMLKHLMMPWHLNIWKFKIWLSQEWQELLKWNKIFFLVSKVLSFRHTK